MNTQADPGAWSERIIYQLGLSGYAGFWKPARRVESVQVSLQSTTRDMRGYLLFRICVYA